MKIRLLKTRTLAAIMVAAAVGAAYLFWGAVPEKRKQAEVPRLARPVKTAVIAASGGGGPRIFPGRVQASQKVDLAFRVSGQIVELPAVKGSFAEPGALLARLDPRDFEVQLANAKSELGSARARLDAMKSGARKEEIAMLSAKVNSARAQMNDAKATLDRVENMFKAGGMSRSEYEKAQTAYEVTRMAYQAASQELSAGRTGSRAEDLAAMEFTIQGIEAKVKTAENALADTALKAPFAGVVIDRYADNNQSVQRDQPIVSLQDIAALEVTISVPETLVLQTPRDSIHGMEARFASLPGVSFPLSYKEASAQADPVTQTYSVSFSLPVPEGITVLPGMTADVLIPRPAGGGRADAELPANAVMGGEGTGHFVWRVEGTESLFVKKIPVEVTGYRGGMALVKGAAPGDRIVTAGVSLLMEGDPVTLYTPPGS
ncbi:MAG: efflux RND transporter periplasmic adaptor subunit [Aminivibrio sp.]|nr:efflux RND transporter periplasmic adaptor subunit [Synergistaceae bacterium]